MPKQTIWNRTLKKFNKDEISLSELKDCVQEAITSFLTPDEHSAQSFQEYARQESGGLLGPSREGGLQTTDSIEKNRKLEKILVAVLENTDINNLSFEAIKKLIEKHFGPLDKSESNRLKDGIEKRLGDELDSLRVGEEDLKRENREGTQNKNILYPNFSRKGNK